MPGLVSLGPLQGTLGSKIRLQSGALTRRQALGRPVMVRGAESKRTWDHEDDRYP